jgi:hypothetical protein
MIWALIFMFVGVIALSSSMKRHFKQCYPQRKMPSLRLLFIFRMSGYLSLFISIYFCIIAQGIGLGLVVWFGAVTVVTLVQAMLLSYRPKWIISIGTIVLFCAAYTRI